MEKGKFWIVRGVYLTGVGQEDEVFNFKISTRHKDIEKITRGCVCVTFYQQENVITSIPAIIRVCNIVNGKWCVEDAQRKEKLNGYPTVPIVSVMENFDIQSFMEIVGTFEAYQKELMNTHRNEQKPRKKEGENTEQMALF